MSVCTVPDCDRPVKARGWCQKHYERWRRFGDPLTLAGRGPRGDPPPARDFTDGAWRADAACHGMRADIFFPDPSDTAGAALAQSICADCPVRAPCAEHALTAPERYGIWGGLTEDQRQRMRRARTRRMTTR